MQQKSIFDHIKDQPRLVVDKIYNGMNDDSYWACAAVFQSLSMLAKCYTMRLIFLHSSFHLEQLKNWIADDSIKFHDSAIEELICLRIIVEKISSVSDINESSENGPLYEMNPNFKNGFKPAIVKPKEPWSDHVSITLKFDRSPPSHEDLINYSMDKWNEVLGILVQISPSSGLNSDSSLLRKFIQRSDLMAPKSVSSSILQLTAKGYEFLLQDYSTQIWEFVLQSIKYSSSQEDVLSFLFILSHCTAGKAYPIEALTLAQKDLVMEFNEFGIIFLRSLNSSFFYPTQVAIDMIYGQNKENYEKPKNENNISTNTLPTSFLNNKSLQIIVETNLQVVAYVYSDMHLAMLQLFVDVSLRLPNMAMGRITRDKSKQAFKIGIKSSQIVNFLIMHAHPLTTKRNPVIPENVVDQLELWELENHRIKTQETILVDCRDLSGVSMTNKIFCSLLESLKMSDVLLWHDENSMMVAVAPHGYSLIQSFFQAEFNM